jgi:hypothetical protein
VIGDPCIARYESDQVRCAECRLVWDRNDPDPPECGRKAMASPPLVPTKAEVLDRYWKWRGAPAGR